jgi:anti-sigma factor RsiW
MKCPNKLDEQILVEYCSGTLDARRASEVEGHAAQCAECAASIAEQNSVLNVLDDFTVPQVTPEFNARLYARIEQEQRGRWWKQFWHTAWKPALATVGVGAALVIGLTVNVPQASDAPRKGSVESVDMDQVEHALEDLDLLSPGSGGNKL